MQVDQNMWVEDSVKYLVEFLVQSFAVVPYPTTHSILINDASSNEIRMTAREK